MWRGAQLVAVNALLLLRLLILARLLAPDDFGLLAIAVSAIAIGLNLTDFGIVPALVQHPRVSQRHYDAGWTVGLARAVVVAAAVAASAPFIASLFAEPRATDVVRALAVKPVIDALVSIKTVRLTRNLEFRPLAIWRVAEAATNTVVSIALASALGVWALVVGALAGAAASVVASYAVAPNRPRIVFDRAATRSLLAFGRWVFATALLITGTTLVLRATIARELDSGALGVYFLAARLAFMPAEIAAQVVGDVTFPVYVKLRATPVALLKAFQGVLTGLGALLLPIALVIAVLASRLTADLLGPGWDGAAPVIRVLAIVSVLGLVGDVAVPLFHGVGRPRLVTLLESIQFVLVGGLVTVLVRWLGLTGAAASWLVAVAVSLVVSVRLLRGLLRRPFDGLGARGLVVGAGAVLAAVVAAGVSAVVPGAVGVVAAALAGVGGSLALVWLADRRLALCMLDDLVRVFPRLAGQDARRPSADPK